MELLTLPVLISIWIFGAAIVGIAGSDKEGGFFNGFIYSLLASPLIGAIIVAGTQSKYEVSFQKESFELNKRILAALSEKAAAEGI